MTPADLAESLIPPAAMLVGTVHGGGDRNDIRQLIGHYTTRELQALAVILAAMVNPEATVSELLTKFTDHNDDTDSLYVPDEHNPGLAPHGTHSAFNRHIARDTIPCHACVIGERAYQRDRKRRQRANANLREREAEATRAYKARQAVA